MVSWYYREYYTPAAPKSVKGGIKASTRRGDFGQSWWAKRWIAVLESFNIGARLGRGRSYARRGQVVSISVEKGSVTAAVQGTRPKPYEVAISVKTLSGQEWTKIISALSKQVIFAAKLLAGEMPDDIEDVFQEQKLSLFPQKLKDLKTDCSCPDWSNPCKHIAAVYYLLGEEFDRDPFLIFKLRGLDRKELLGRLGTPSNGRTGKPGGHSIGTETEPSPVRTPEPLPEDPDSFWGSAKQGPAPQEEVLIPKLPGALPKRLGSFPMWRGTEPFLESLEQLYASASCVGLEVYLSEGKNTPES